jgi:hypothetical protein
MFMVSEFAAADMVVSFPEHSLKVRPWNAIGLRVKPIKCVESRAA